MLSIPRPGRPGQKVLIAAAVTRDGAAAEATIFIICLGACVTPGWSGVFHAQSFVGNIAYMGHSDAPAYSPRRRWRTARAENRRFGLLSGLRAHTKTPGKNGLIWETLRALNRPGRAQTEGQASVNS